MNTRALVRQVGLEPTPPFGPLGLSQVSLPFLYQRVIPNGVGVLPEIRTLTLTTLEVVASAVGLEGRWCFERESNPHCPRSKRGSSASWDIEACISRWPRDVLERSDRICTRVSQVELERPLLNDDRTKTGGSAGNRTQTNCLRDSRSRPRATEPRCKRASRTPCWTVLLKRCLGRCSWWVHSDSNRNLDA